MRRAVYDDGLVRVGALRAGHRKSPPIRRFCLLRASTQCAGLNLPEGMI